MAMGIVCGSQFGQIVRVLTNRRVFKYPEETSDETCQRYLVSKGLVDEENQNIRGLYTFISPCLTNQHGEQAKEQAPNPNLVK
jgi:hypothetical protein